MLTVVASAVQARGHLGEHGVYSVLLWEILVVLPCWHTERAAAHGDGETGGAETAHVGALQWQEVGRGRGQHEML